jgi:hypothetical protein
MYGLIDPRENKICYIGITNDIKNRIKQHNRPKLSNLAPIAKLCRHLKEKGLKLGIVELNKSNKLDEINSMEIKTIAFFRELGVNLLNIQEGGERTNNSKESIERMIVTRKKNNNLGLHKSVLGESNNNAKLNNDQVIEIYNLIKQFYSNEEIITYLNLKCGVTVIHAIRSGQNWGHLWPNYFTEIIPSIYMGKNGINPRIKLKVIDLIVKGYDLNHIKKRFKRVNHDVFRVAEKTIWVKVWEIYYKFYIK